MTSEQDNKAQGTTGYNSAFVLKRDVKLQLTNVLMRRCRWRGQSQYVKQPVAYGRPLWTYRVDCYALHFLYNALLLLLLRVVDVNQSHGVF